MAVTAVASNNGLYSGVTGPTVSATWTPLEGDVVVAFVGSTTSAFPAASRPSGWSYAAGLNPINLPGSACAMQVLWHTVTSAEQTAGTTSWDLAGAWAAAEIGAWTFAVLRGDIDVDPIDSVSHWLTNTTASPHILNGIPGEAVNSGNLVLSCVMSDGGSQTYSTPSGWTQLQQGAVDMSPWLGYRDTATVAGDDVDAVNITRSGAADEAISVTLVIGTRHTPPYSLVASSSGTQVNIADPVVGATWTPQEGDYILVALQSPASDTTVSLPSGWDEIVPIMDPGDLSMTTQALYHVVTSAEETAVTNTWTLTGLWGGSPRVTNYVLVVLRGINGIDSAASALQDTTINPFALPSLSGANLSSNSVVVSMIIADSSSRYYVLPAGYDSIAEGFGGIAIIRQTLTSAGVDVSATNIYADRGDEFCAITVALLQVSGAEESPLLAWTI